MSQTPTLDLKRLDLLLSGLANDKLDGARDPFTKSQAERATNDAAQLRLLRDSLPSLLEDKARIDWLDARIKDEAAWTDFLIQHDWEDGVWISTVERGQTLGARAIDDSPTPLHSLREAIDAAKSPSVPSAPPLR